MNDKEKELVDNLIYDTRQVLRERDAPKYIENILKGLNLEQQIYYLDPIIMDAYNANRLKSVEKAIISWPTKMPILLLRIQIQRMMGEEKIMNAPEHQKLLKCMLGFFSGNSIHEIIGIIDAAYHAAGMWGTKRSAKKDEIRADMLKLVLEEKLPESKAIVAKPKL